ncbi:efflux RND transporter permease subunit [Marinobacterium jannaschii]|uniref:efflux RND transporter permease subunit n=1 Tax=Marinobacterium jannaschii TaxID=64970 RepID=UPI00047FA786|nr:MMPL family transporter [Marinobacterium jannaschii]
MMNNNDTLKFSVLTQLIFRHRLAIILFSLLATLYLAWQASFVRPDTRLERLIPGSHEFVLNAKTFLGNETAGGSSVIRVAVARSEGTIFDYEHLVTLQKISDELSLLDGVDTGSINSLWAPGMLWFAITPEGFGSGPVIDNATFNDSAESMDLIRTNVFRAGIVGSYVSNDFKASMIDFEVLPINPTTRAPIDFNEFSERLEQVRQKYQNDDLSIHVIGDVKKVADLVDGFGQIALFFLAAFVITAVLLFNYSRCYKSTLIPLLCSVVAVVWQLGILNLMGYGLGVFSVLVPFLVFAIAVSHGVQVINAIAHETAKGEDRLNASRVTFHHLHKAGLVALISDGIGFATLFVIDIGGIKDLAMVASVGVALVIFTNLVLLPVLMSYVGVTQRCVDHAQHKLENKTALWDGLSHFAEPKLARGALVVALVLVGVGTWYSQGLKIGDLDKGAPELRADSRYNLDNNYITGNFTTSTDLMTIFMGMPEGLCETYKAIDLIDRLGWQLENTQGVKSVASPATRAKLNRYLGNEGNLKMMALPRDERVLSRAIAYSGFTTTGGGGACDQQQLNLELTDHKQETLQRVVSVVRDFANANDDAEIWFRLGDGNAAYEAATNEVIDRAQYEILAYVYGIVALMILLMFRSIKAVICILLPLALTSLLCQALMAVLGIGVKVATLPVIALGVGIGVDYGIYIYSRLHSYMELGHPLRLAYLEALKTTGKAVSFTGVTLAIGVATWILSPIKFQADMGILLTFMFLWNMVGALTLLPALAHFLLKAPAPVEEAFGNASDKTLSSGS